MVMGPTPPGTGAVSYTHLHHCASQSRNIYPGQEEVLFHDSGRIRLSIQPVIRPESASTKMKAPMLIKMCIRDRDSLVSVSMKLRSTFNGYDRANWHI